MEFSKDATRRGFFQTVGLAPSLALIAGDKGPPPPVRPGKFTPIDLSSYFNAAPRELGPDFGAQEDLRRVPSGSQRLQGIPFLLGPGGEKKSWLVLREQTVEMPLPEQQAGFLCLAQFCDTRGALISIEPDRLKPGEEEEDGLGARLADAVLVYADGGEEAFPIRRRFEVNALSIAWGQLSFAARPHRQDGTNHFTDPLRHGNDWGDLQTAVAERSYGKGTLWVWALPNAQPERTLRALRLHGVGGPLVVCGLTLFHGREHPLRCQRLSLYRITLPEGAEPEDRWKVSVDLGVVARAYTLGEFQPEHWLAAPEAGIGETQKRPKPLRHLYVELAAARDATLSLADTQTGRGYSFDLSRVVPGGELTETRKEARIEVLEPQKVWLHGKVTDQATGQPTPARLAFRSREGRYIPPYGHRTEINDAWFQDYGADVKLLDSSFAYVDGTFQVELPVGEVFVEVFKGFEYGAGRRQLRIEPGQRELDLPISRFIDLRAKGWMTADTHVHFLSPSTAVLEGQAEGLNLINLLAAQWGDLFTNVGDLAHGPLTSRDGETTVRLGTENRQHFLGHIGLLGGYRDPVYPMSASGPGESYVGDPMWSTMADWADECRKNEGLVVAVHFPYPTAELAADIVLGKIDAVEIYPYGDFFNTLRLRDWYRYLNCGYRVPCAGGTDKMAANIPVGANRTYAWVGNEGFDFANWAKAVRKGRTFATTGPLLLLEVDGRMPGDEIQMSAAGGTVEIRVEARSRVPFHRLEVVHNGRAVLSREAPGGTRELMVAEKLNISGPSWIAARCASKHGPTSWGLGIQAHTSPVYVRVPGQDLFSASAASYMLKLVDGAATWLDTLATRPDRERFERAQKVFQQARAHLDQRLQKRR